MKISKHYTLAKLLAIDRPTDKELKTKEATAGILSSAMMLRSAPLEMPHPPCFAQAYQNLGICIMEDARVMNLVS